jgi:hypothetical protein
MEPTVRSYLVQVNTKYQAGLRLQEGKKVFLVKAKNAEIQPAGVKMPKKEDAR